MGVRILLSGSWVIGIIGVLLFTRMASGDDYWRFRLPGIILEIIGINTVYFMGNVTIVATASEKHQGTVSGVYTVRYDSNLIS